MAQAELYQLLRENAGTKLSISQLRILYEQRFNRSIPKSAVATQMRKLWLTDMNIQCERVRDARTGRIYLVYWYEER